MEIYENLLIRCSTRNTQRKVKHTGVQYQAYANEREEEETVAPVWAMPRELVLTSISFLLLLFFFFLLSSSRFSSLFLKADWLWAAFGSCVNPLCGPHTNLLLVIPPLLAFATVVSFLFVLLLLLFFFFVFFSFFHR